MKKEILKKIKETLPTIQENVLLKDYTTYKIGGPAKYFFIAKTLGRSPLGRNLTGKPTGEAKEGLTLALKVAKELKLPIFILGGGSNILFSDKGIKGLVVKINITNVDFQGNKVIIGAGADLTKLAYMLSEKSFSGLEWAVGIPGTVGGAIYGNAQAFGTKISDAVESVDALDIKTLMIKTFSREQCKFSLKNSIFKRNKNLVIISAVLEFKQKDKSEIDIKIKEYLEYRKKRHPMTFASAGSAFVNPEIKIKNRKLLEKYPELKEYNEKGVIPAGYLIAKSGLAGKKIGKAQISEKHANFIINLGGAKAKDVKVLIAIAQKKVKKNFNILLKPEIQFVGFK